VTRRRLLSGPTAIAAVAALIALGAFAFVRWWTKRERVEVLASPPTTPGVAFVAAVEVTGGPYRLKGTLVRPEGPGPFRGLVYNHGSEPEPSFDYMRRVGTFFQRHGYVVLFPFRRGAAGSEGTHWQKTVKALPAAEQAGAVAAAIDAESEDVLAAIEWLRKLPSVDPNAVAVAGCSFGGVEALLVAARTRSVFAALDFAGGSVSWKSNSPLRELMTRAAREAQVPVFYLQAENDYDTAPTLLLAEESRLSAKPFAAHIYPPHGTTKNGGHSVFCHEDIKAWGQDVLAFLDAQLRDAGSGVR
jgi:dienelactone hydrolase